MSIDSLITNATDADDLEELTEQTGITIGSSNKPYLQGIFQDFTPKKPQKQSVLTESASSTSSETCSPRESLASVSSQDMNADPKKAQSSKLRQPKINTEADLRAKKAAEKRRQLEQDKIDAEMEKQQKREAAAARFVKKYEI